MFREFRPALTGFVLLTVITGLVYPFVVTGIAQLVFPHQANGSLIVQNGIIRGSELIGQSFSDPRYFWGRPSATSPMPYNGAASGGSNLGPTNPALIDAVKARIQALKDADPGNTQRIPVDLITASASGLDPDISPAAAEYQINRVARARHIDPAVLTRLVQQHLEGRQFGLLGERRVNVLKLNLALDNMAPLIKSNGSHD